MSAGEYAEHGLVVGGNMWEEVAGEMRRRVEKLLRALAGGLQAMGAVQ